MTETRTGALVHALPLEAEVTSCCGLDVAALPTIDEVVEPSTDLALVSCAGLCRRCGRRPGRERYYKPGHPGEASYSLAGVTPKISVRQTVGCDGCWAEFVDLRRATGYPEPNGGSEPPVRPCCGQRHDGPECLDGLVPCALCFERVRRDQLHRLPDGSFEDVCAPCAELERRALAAVEALPPEAYVYGAPWPPTRSRPWHVVRPGWTALAGHLRGREWLCWVLVWLAGCALVVGGGGLDGVVTGVGLVATGVGGGLLVRWLWERLS